SMVSLVLIRKAVSKPIEVKAIREEILLSSVPYYGMLPGDIGYIRLAGETRGSADDVKEALLSLKSQHKLKGLILDLRGNIGGYMNEAIRTVNLFVEKGRPILSIRSWYHDTTYYLPEEAIDTKLPLAVLTDTMTASSAEILSGALQDHDRGVIIGQKTFGKGLIQQLFDMPGGEMLSITTGYYHTPSGRCIQRKEYDKKREGELIADSLKKYFHTRNGRSVIDHDGVVPDVIIRIPAKAGITQALSDPWSYDHVFRFASQYVSAHPTIAPAATFRISDADYNAFVNFLQTERLTIPGVSDAKLDDLVKALEQQGYQNLGSAEIEKIRQQLTIEKEKEFYRYKDELKELVEREIAALYYFNWGRVENSLKNDVVIRKAAEILGNRQQYADILK
ncbi:MAG: S41 family peptidase, partial [Pedobacter agri]